VLNSNRPLDEVLGYIARQTRQLFGSQAVAICSRQGEAGTWAVQAVHGVPVGCVARADDRVVQESLRRAVASRQPVTVPDIAAALAGDGDLAGGAERQAEFYRALLAVPIVIQDDVYGGMCLYYAEPRALSDSDVYQFIVVYDPAGGFVTGGGWIMSPEGACPDFCGGATGKANFGFVSKYKKGASTPTGQTEFQFKAGDLNFHSSSYDWLVVAGANAKYKGVGTVNGGGNYGFMLTATDADVNDNDAHDVDLFRIKIWDKDNGDAVVYDNQMGAGDDSYDGTALGGGNIKVHQAK
jgi:hypothetical protein